LIEYDIYQAIAPPNNYYLSCCWKAFFDKGRGTMKKKVVAVVTVVIIGMMSVSAVFEPQVSAESRVITDVNRAEPEQANGKTIAQCLFYIDYLGRTGFAGTGAFSFDKRTVDNLAVGPYGDPDQIISTTRKIDWLFIPGLLVFGTDSPSSTSGGEVRGDVFSIGLRDRDFSEIWYTGLGYQAGTIRGMRRTGETYLVDGWRISGQRYDLTYFMGLWFEQSGDTIVHGSWGISVEHISLDVNGGGYFDCTLSDEGDMSACGGTYTLKNNEWKQISLPCLMPVHHTVLSMFPNMPGSYGKDWVVYRYGNVWQAGTSEYKYQYEKIKPEWQLNQGEGYWIIQASDAPVTLSMPKGSIPALVSAPPACTSSKGCYVTSVRGKKHWDMIGYPFAQAGALNDLRVTSGSTECRVTMYKPQKGWNLADAKKQSVVHNQLWSYTGKGYRKINAGDTLEPWNAYWLWILPESKGMSLLFPKP
jgi:hypothetical protein